MARVGQLAPPLHLSKILDYHHIRARSSSRSKEKRFPIRRNRQTPIEPILDRRDLVVLTGSEVMEVQERTAIFQWCGNVVDPIFHYCKCPVPDGFQYEALLAARIGAYPQAREPVVVIEVLCVIKRAAIVRLDGNPTTILGCLGSLAALSGHLPYFKTARSA